jgi:hypothetical protein
MSATSTPLATGPHDAAGRDAAARATGWARAAAVAAMWALTGTPAAWAQAPANGGPGIFTCIDSQGRRLTADRPIPACADREQQVLNRDGSLRRIHPPSLTAEERAAREAQERVLAQQRAAHAEAVRRDRNLLMRYPDEPSHQRAREAALDTVRLAMRATENRMRDLEQERKPLEAESEFFIGREMPARLRAQINAVDAATAAQYEAAAQQRAELGRINRLYDIELERLRRLWAGAAPGSMGALPSPQQAANGRPSGASPTAMPVGSP